MIVLKEDCEITYFKIVDKLENKEKLNETDLEFMRRYPELFKDYKFVKRREAK